MTPDLPSRAQPSLRALPAHAGTGVLAAVSGLALALLLVVPAAPARAQCDGDPNTVFCAEVRIGAPRRPPARQAQSRVIVVQPAPPPPPPPPAPRVIVVQPAPQPPPPPPRRVVVVTSQTTTTTTTNPAPPVVTPAPARPRLEFPGRDEVGVRVFLGGVGIPEGGMAGLGAALRLRPMEHVGVDLGVGLYGGVDADERARGELPFTADVRWIFNGYERLQFYGLLGVGLSFAAVEELDGRQRDFVHVGGSVGLGAEYFLAPSFSLSADVRGFVRQAVSSSDGEPEFVDLDENESTDTSAGALFTLGAAFYF